MHAGAGGLVGGGPRDDPCALERARVHLVREVYRDARGLGWVRPDEGAEDARAVVERGRRLRVVEPHAGQRAAATEPREVLAVPVVTPLVGIVGIVIP